MLLQITMLGDVTKFSSHCTHETQFVYTLGQNLAWRSLFKFLKNLAQHLFEALTHSGLWSCKRDLMSITILSRAEVFDSALLFKDRGRATVQFICFTSVNSFRGVYLSLMSPCIWDITSLISFPLLFRFPKFMDLPNFWDCTASSVWFSCMLFLHISPPAGIIHSLQSPRNYTGREYLCPGIGSTWPRRPFYP